jgi:predicted dehydrogenase
MKCAIDAGQIGTPVLGTVAMFSWRDEAYYRSDPWRGRWDTEGGGVLINQSPHHIDILQWLMGPVEEVVGRWANLNHPFIEVEDTALGILRFRNGALGAVTVSLSQRPGLYTKIHVHGSSGASVGAQTDSGATFIAGVSGIAEPALNDVWTVPGEEHCLTSFQEDDRRFFASVDATGYYHTLQVQDFVDAVRTGREPYVTGWEGRKVVRIIEAMYRSGREGTTVRFD